jgi:ubiquitin-protein ligase
METDNTIFKKEKDQEQNHRVIKKETIQRLLKDVKQIMRHPLTDNGIYYSHDETDMMKGYALIVGPSETPYFGGFYFFKFNFPCDYPFSPPKVTYMTNDGTTRFNPNLYKCGKVCVSILNTWNGDKWSSCQTINSVLLTLCSLLNNAPLENEPGHNKSSKEFMPYQKSIEFSNINFAVCDMINRCKQKIPYPFEIFYPFMRESFLKCYDKLVEFVESKQQENGTQVVNIYSMNTNIDYVSLKTKLLETRNIVENDKI